MTFIMRPYSKKVRLTPKQLPLNGQLPLIEGGRLEASQMYLIKYIRHDQREVLWYSIFDNFAKM